MFQVRQGRSYKLLVSPCEDSDLGLGLRGKVNLSPSRSLFGAQVRGTVDLSISGSSIDLN
jgi:hypothetical protein